MTMPVHQKIPPTNEVIKLIKKIIHVSSTEIHLLPNSCFNKVNKVVISIIKR